MKFLVICKVKNTHLTALVIYFQCVILYFKGFKQIVFTADSKVRILSFAGNKFGNEHTTITV